MEHISSISTFCKDLDSRDDECAFEEFVFNVRLDVGAAVAIDQIAPAELLYLIPSLLAERLAHSHVLLMEEGIV